MSLLQRLRDLLASPNTTEAELEAALRAPTPDYVDTQPSLEPESAPEAVPSGDAADYTPQQLMQAGIRNGMSAEEVASRLATFVPPDLADDPYPCSRRATASDVQRAGITNGMSADEVERCLARVMSA